MASAGGAVPARGNSLRLTAQHTASTAPRDCKARFVHEGEMRLEQGNVARATFQGQVL